MSLYRSPSRAIPVPVILPARFPMLMASTAPSATRIRSSVPAGACPICPDHRRAGLHHGVPAGERRGRAEGGQLGPPMGDVPIDALQRDSDLDPPAFAQPADLGGPAR